MIAVSFQDKRPTQFLVILKKSGHGAIDKLGTLLAQFYKLLQNPRKRWGCLGHVFSAQLDMIELYHHLSNTQTPAQRCDQGFTSLVVALSIAPIRPSHDLELMTGDVLHSILKPGFVPVAAPSVG